MIIYRENLYHAQELQKQSHNKGVRPQSDAPSMMVRMNSKYIKTKRNRKLEIKFFEPFRMLYPVGKHAYKLEPTKNWKIHDVFHVSLLEQESIKKRQEFLVPEFELGDNKEYEVEAIWVGVIQKPEVGK